MQHSSKKLAGKCLSALPAIFMMSIIFYFSSQSAAVSTAQSSAVSSLVIKIASFLSGLGFQNNVSITIAKVVEIAIRKFSHIFEFFCLAIAVYIPHKLYVDGRYKRYIVSGLFCVLYAISDEVHQIFVPGRGPAVVDVLIDSLGILFAMLLISFSDSLHERRKKKHER